MSRNQAGAMCSSQSERIILPSANMAASIVDKIAVISTAFMAVPAQVSPLRCRAATIGLVFSLTAAWER